MPQGLILGPLLFLIYINDLVNCSNILKFILFADDSNLYASHKDLHVLISIINRELKIVREWILSNKLTLNISKSHYLIFHRKRVPVVLDPIVMGDQNLERMTNTKFLGVILEENLKWDKHIQFVADKVNKISGLLYLTRHKLSFNAMKHIYFSLVYPHFVYCQTVWGAAGNSKLNQLVIAQNSPSKLDEILAKCGNNS